MVDEEKQPEPAVESHESVPQPESEKKEPEEKKLTEKEELHKKAAAILAKYGGKESEIPLSSEYWDLMNQFRAK